MVRAESRVQVKTMKSEKVSKPIKREICESPVEACRAKKDKGEEARARERSIP